MTSQRSACLALLLTLALAGCAKSERALPGDSVSADGGVTLTPPKPIIGPQSAAPAEPLGAIESKLFPPELIMENQTLLAIDALQRDRLLAEIESAQTELLKLQWDLQGEKEKLVTILDHDVVDEAAATAAGTRVMQRENAVKAAHLQMLVKLKNLLTPAQKATLRALRSGDAGAK